MEEFRSDVLLVYEIVGVHTKGLRKLAKIHPRRKPLLPFSCNGVKVVPGNGSKVGRSQYYPSNLSSIDPLFLRIPLVIYGLRPWFHVVPRL